MERPAHHARLQLAQRSSREFEVLADAQGTVALPNAEQRPVTLRINADGAADLSFLSNLDPYGIQALELHDTLLDARQVTYLTHLTGLRALDIARCAITAEGLAHLRQMSHLQQLTVGVIQDPSAAALASLSTLEHLERLEINLTELSGNELAALQSLPRLRDLRLMAAHGVSLSGWEAIGKLITLRSLEVGGSSLTDEALRSIGKLENLETLYVDRTPLDGSGLVHLRALSLLRTFTADGSGIQSRNLVHLRDLPALEEVHLALVPVLPEGLAHLAHIPRLTRLTFYESLSSSEGLDQLLQSPLLEELDLTGSDLDDAGLAVLGQMRQMRVLSLDGSIGITDRGVGNLAGLQALRTLSIGPADIGDAGAAAVAHLAVLETLWLGANQLTSTGLAHLSRLTGLNQLGIDCPRSGANSLKYLERLVNLRHLTLARLEGAQPSDLAFLRNLPALRILTIWYGYLPEGSLAILGELSALRDLNLCDAHITDVGMEHLAGLRGIAISGTLEECTNHAGYRKLSPHRPSSST